MRLGMRASLGVRASAVAIAAAVVVGCGSSGEKGTENAKTVSEAKPSGDVTWCIGKDTTGAFSTTVDAFNKQNPKANVELLELPTASRPNPMSATCSAWT